MPIIRYTLDRVPSCATNSPVYRGAKDFGGGTSDTPGHGAWMQALPQCWFDGSTFPAWNSHDPEEVGHSKPVEVLTGLPDWQTFYQDYVRANRFPAAKSS